MNIHKIHFIGIKGVGMTALALFCKEKGFCICGSDIGQEFQTDQLLKKYAITVFQTFNKANITGFIDLVIYSAAFDPKKNCEIREAEKRRIPTISYGEALGMFMNGQTGISIAGTHGKTTSAAILATILMQAGMDPSYIIGCAGIPTLPASGHYGKGAYFITEADEYLTALNFDRRPKFLWQNPSFALITNVEYDHPDVFKNLQEVKAAFGQFIGKIPKTGFLIYNGDDNNLQELVTKASCQLISYGQEATNQYILKSISFVSGSTKIQINHNQKNISLKLKIPGKHNGLNVCGVYALATTLGIKTKMIDRAINKFTGTKRRFEYIAGKNGIVYYDDYAHHPTEIFQTLLAVKSWYPSKRVIVVFQPHTFSRTLSLLKEFSTAFISADVVIITEIFASSRENKKNFNISGKVLAEKIAGNHPRVFFAADFKKVMKYLKAVTQKDDIVITMGAGDIYKFHDLING